MSQGEEDEDEGDPSSVLWQPRVKHSLATRLQPGTFFFSPPARYVFPGAEVKEWIGLLLLLLFVVLESDTRAFFRKQKCTPKNILQPVASQFFWKWNDCFK